MQHGQRKLSFLATGLLGGFVMAFGFALSATAAETLVKPDSVKVAAAEEVARSAEKNRPPVDSRSANVVYAEKTASGARPVKVDQSRASTDNGPAMLFYCSGASCYDLLGQFVVEGK